MNVLFKQAWLLPFYFFIPVTIAGFLVDDYSSIAEHGSALSLSDNATARTLLSTGAISAGVSCILLALGVVLKTREKHLLSGVLLMLFGTSMISNGLYPMGDPMHGIYGMGLSMMLVPFVVCYEVKGPAVRTRFYTVTLIAGLVNFVYFWALLVGVDPVEYSGLTQRIASLFIFGWIAYWGFASSKLYTKP